MSIEALRAQIQDLPSGDHTHTAFKFLLAGYYWKHSRFQAWTFKYDVLKNEFNAFSMPASRHQFVFMSDDGLNELEARKRLFSLLYRGAKTQATKLDWQPLQVLLSFIQDSQQGDIGGPPQILKVYKHANVMPINVLWPEEILKQGLRTRTYSINHLGRPLLDYERTRRLTLDPIAGEFVEPWNVRERVAAYNDCEVRKISDRLRAKIAALLERRKTNLELQEQLRRMVADGALFTEMLEASEQWKGRSTILGANDSTSADDYSTGLTRLQARR
jgi:hypothetical protein